MKAVLTNRIYLDFREDLYARVKEELTYKIPSKMHGAPPKIIRLYHTIGKALVLSIPSGREDLIPKDYEVVDRRAVAPEVFPDFAFTLRKDQQEIFKLVNGSCLINANPSWGKTFTGIAIAAKLKQKTLVIVHTTALRDQWVKEVKKTLGFKPSVIGGGKIETRGCLVVSNIQTLRKHANTFKDMFGTIIVDEVHHAPSKVFSDTLNIFRAKNKIGLSGTLKRKDFMHVVLPDYFSKDILVASSSNQMEPEVHIYDTGIPFGSNPMIPWANKVNELVDRPEYVAMVAGLAQAYINRGHKVLIVGDRTKFLKDLGELLPNLVVITGEIKSTEERDALLLQVREGSKDGIAGAISIFKEGISEDHLSCVILGAPTNNDPMLEQIVGRVQRIQKGKLTPVCVDLKLEGSTAKRQAYARASFYASKGWPCKLIDIR
ncbi:MAG: DEAD/DEAH box helicase family protein [Aureispira sp.]|nr:DEAD/DEAH box helicase family protein [Aureispira sp.]